MENLNQQVDEMEQLSPEELAKRKEEMLSFYTDSLPYLNAQYEYESILAKIDEVRFKRASIQVQFGMLMQSQSEHNQIEDDAETEPETESLHAPKERKLKKS
jgi:hypothetical protein